MDNNEHILSRKNTLALKQAVQELNSQVHEQQKRLDTMQATLSNYAIKIAALELVILQQRAATVGRGPTVKE